VTSTLVVLPADLMGTILALPVLEALAASGRRVVTLASPAAAPLVVLSPAVAETLSLESPQTALATLLKTGCGEAVVLDPGGVGAKLARAAGIAPRWGYRGLVRSFGLDRPIRPPKPGPRPAREDFRELLAALDVPWPATFAGLEVSDALRAQARERLDRANVGQDRPRIGIYPGSESSGTRPWPRSNFDELLRQLRRRRPGGRFVLTTTLADLWRAVRVFEETGKIHPVIGPDLRVDVLAAVLAELDLWIGGDSWMGHLAAAVGTPTVALSRRDPRRWAPLGEAHHTLSLKSLDVEGVVETVSAAVAAR